MTYRGAAFVDDGDSFWEGTGSTLAEVVWQLADFLDAAGARLDDDQDLLTIDIEKEA